MCPAADGPPGVRSPNMKTDDPAWGFASVGRADRAGASYAAARSRRSARAEDDALPEDALVSRPAAAEYRQIAPHRPKPVPTGPDVALTAACAGRRLGAGGARTARPASSRDGRRSRRRRPPRGQDRRLRPVSPVCRTHGACEHAPMSPIRLRRGRLGRDRRLLRLLGVAAPRQIPRGARPGDWPTRWCAVRLPADVVESGAAGRAYAAYGGIYVSSRPSCGSGASKATGPTAGTSPAA